MPIRWMPALIAGAAIGSASCWSPGFGLTGDAGASHDTSVDDSAWLFDTGSSDTMAVDPITDLPVYDSGDGSPPVDPGTPECDLDFIAGMIVAPDRVQTDCGSGCTQITLNDEAVEYFVSGDDLVYLAYEDPSYGSFRMCGWIYHVDLDTLETALLFEPDLDRCERTAETTFPIGFENSSVHVVHIYIAEVDGELMWKDSICRYGLVTGEVNPIWAFTSTGEFGSASAWHVHNEKIVWLDAPERIGGQDVDWLDTAAGEYRALTTTGSVSRPDLWGDLVVWEDFRHLPQKLVMYDASTGVAWEPLPNDADRLWPSIWGNILVWEDCRQDDCGGMYVLYNTDIFMMDLSTGVETRITDAPGPQDEPSITGNYITWLDSRFDDEYTCVSCPGGDLDKWEVFLYDIEEGREYRFTDNYGFEKSASVEGERVFFIMKDETGAPSVFMKSISSIKEASPE